MITKKDIRKISNGLYEFGKRSKDISVKSDYHRTTVKIKATNRNAVIIAEMIDFLGDFDWGEVDDYQSHEFYKYDEIWYLSIDSRWAPDADEMAKYEKTPWYDVLLDFS